MSLVLFPLVSKFIYNMNQKLGMSIFFTFIEYKNKKKNNSNKEFRFFFPIDK
jgi:hypothetical protein